MGAAVGADGRIVQSLNHDVKHQGPIAGPRHSHPAIHTMNTTYSLILREHLYSFEWPISDHARIRVETEHLPTAHVSVSYLLVPDWLRLVIRLIEAGARRPGQS